MLRLYFKDYFRYFGMRVEVQALPVIPEGLLMSTGLQ